tara:strand:- start:604 stop:1203 length:600 start_codon:yes stop_codon:yes gene_type:complete
MKKMLFLLATLLAFNVNAATINFGPGNTTGFPVVGYFDDTITFENLSTPTMAFSDAIVTLNVRGDYDGFGLNIFGGVIAAIENLNVNIDGLDLGTIFNGNVNDDAFNFPGDAGGNTTTLLTGTATISQAAFNALIADSLLTLTFTESFLVAPTLELYGTITFADMPNVSQVPIPAAAMLFAPALLGFFGLRRKVKTTIA